MTDTTRTILIALGVALLVVVVVPLLFHDGRRGGHDGWLEWLGDGRTRGAGLAGRDRPRRDWHAPLADVRVSFRPNERGRGLMERM